MCITIPQNDNIFRGAHYPVAFQRTSFRPAKFMKMFNDNNPRVIEASFVWERFAPRHADVHAYGCRISHRRSRPDRRSIYCGAYQLKAMHVHELAVTPALPEVAAADIVHKVEDNEIAHAGLKVRLVEHVDEESIEGVKTAIAAQLWEKSRGPMLHICKDDRGVADHPNYNLEPAPLGPYVDERSLLTRFGCLLRFWFLLGAWKLGLVRCC
jgi:hypothetical protein